MTNVIWELSFKKRQEFEVQFAFLVLEYVNSYNGKQPIMSWDSNLSYPLLEEEFLKHLPQHIKTNVETLLESFN